MKPYGMKRNWNVTEDDTVNQRRRYHPVITKIWHRRERRKVKDQLKLERRTD
jgi:hypothetical protein